MPVQWGWSHAAVAVRQPIGLKAPEPLCAGSCCRFGAHRLPQRPPPCELLAVASCLPQIGTTKRGIGPAYSSKATRNGVRVGDLRRPDQFAGESAAWIGGAATLWSWQLVPLLQAALVVCS